MTFSETTREGSDSHRDALDRLEAARTDQRRRDERHDAAQGGDGERAAADELAAANEQVAAREAWVDWVERG